MTSDQKLDTTALIGLKSHQLSVYAYAVVVLTMFAVPMSIYAGVELVLVAFFACGLVLFYELRRVRRWSKQKDIALEAFASENDFTYTKADRFIPSEHTGTLFQHGHSPKSSNHMTGKINNMPFNLFEYQYTAPSGKNDKHFYAVVIQFKLGQHLPHIVIDSKMQNALPITFDSSQRVDLEGDFSKFFATYAPDRHGVTLLTILAPDVMETLMKYAATCDIEIIDDNLYIYWPHAAQATVDYENVFETSQEVLRKTSKKLESATLLGYDPAKPINSEIAKASKRLRQNYILGTAIGLVFVLGTIMRIVFDIDERTPLFSERTRTIVGVTTVTPILLLFAYIVYKGLQQTALQRAYKRRSKEM